MKQTDANSTHTKNDSTLCLPTENEPQIQQEEGGDWNKIAREWNKTPRLLQ